MSYFYQLRIRNAANSADELVVTSVPSGTNPFISEPPSGDGQGFNPRTGATEIGAYTVRIADNGSAASAVTGFLADAFGRYDKLGRRAYLEYGTDGTTFPSQLVAGYVNAISFPSAAEAQIAVGESQRTEQNKEAFSTATSAFPATTMLAGGPIRFPSSYPSAVARDFGPWTMKVMYNDGAGIVSLGFVSGYLLRDTDAVDYTLQRDGAFPDYVFQRINTLTASEPRTPFSTYVYGGTTFVLSRIGNVYADIYSGGVLLGTFPALASFTDIVIDYQGLLVVNWTTATPVGTLLQVYLYTRSVNEASPLHIYAHPVDIITGLLTEADEAYDAASAAAVKASVGNDVLLFLRIVQSSSVKTFVDNLLGLFGLGRRVNSANAWVFFDQRTKSNAAPGTTITLSDLREIPSEVWTLPESSIVNRLTVRQLRFAKWKAGAPGTRPADSLIPIEQSRTARHQLSDGSYPDVTAGVHELAYAIPGTIVNALTGEIDLTQFTSALAAPAFDRWGGGAPRSAFACRESVATQLGDETALNLNFLPNANARGGTRIVQVVQRTNEPGGPRIVVEDSGTSAQPAVSPTFSLTANAARPSTSADVALTNAAALAAAGVTAVLFEFVVSASSPASAGQDLGSILPVAPIILTTPVAAAGSKLWVRAKSLQPGRRAGNWTAWISITLTGVGSPTGLVFTPNPADGSEGVVSWTAGTNSAGFPVRVLLRLSALSAANDLPVADLLPSSVRAALSGLTPGSSYTVTVRYVDPASGASASQATLTFVAGATVATLAPPTEPTGIVGRTDANGITTIDGTYGLDVLASTIPGVVEFWEAIETGFGTGVYNPIVLRASVPAVSGAPTSFRAIAPHDGLLRELVARHVRTGVTPSDFTYPVVLDPWGAVQLPGYLKDRFLIRNIRQTDTDTTTTIFFDTDAPEVWVGYVLIDIPEEAADSDALAAAMAPLVPAGTRQFTVPRPRDQQETLFRIDALLGDLGVADSVVSKIVATPDVPHWIYDDIETALVGTEWIKLTPRGISVVAVRAQIQVETCQFTPMAAPTRGPGDMSITERGGLGVGVMGPLEYEQDVPLSAVKGRQNFSKFEWELENGATISSPDFGFDAGRIPHILRALATQAVVSLEGDSDVQSWRVSSGAYSVSRDGQFITLDLAQADDDGTAGLVANASGTFLIEAFNVPANQQAGAGPAYRASTSQDLFVYNGTGSGGSGGSPAATWAEMTLLGPSADGLNDLTIKLRATSAPAGWTVKLFLKDPTSASSRTDITALTTPAAGTVPTVLTTYTYGLAFPRLPWDDPFAVTRSVSVIAELRDATNAVMFTQSRAVSYLASSAT